jgi:hypothetical protein
MSTGDLGIGVSLLVGVQAVVTVFQNGFSL